MSQKTRPTFSMPFIYYMTEKLSAVLERRLRARKDFVTLRMLSCLTALLLYPQNVKGGKVPAIWDGDIVGVIGDVSKMLEFE